MSKVLIFPTDTVYGIGTPIFDAEGIRRIYEIKHRDKAKPLACLCADMKQIEEIACLNDMARKLIVRFFPGALTLILKSRQCVYDAIGYPTIGVRIPNHETALQILRENGPMLTTSVNESGNAPLNEYEEIVKQYGLLVDKIYDTATVSSNISSTVVLCTGEKPVILRQGEIKITESDV